VEAVTRTRSSSGGASRARLAEWERRAVTVLREHAELVTVVDDELPDDLEEAFAFIASCRR